MEVLQVLLAITVLFVILFILKSLIKKEFCVICGAVFITWVSLLILFKLNYFNNQIILAILLGESALGIYYLIDKKLELAKVFRLPLILTLITMAYSLISVPDDLIRVLIFLTITWLLFIIIYSYKSNDKVKILIDKLVKCCKEW